MKLFPTKSPSRQQCKISDVIVICECWQWVHTYLQMFCQLCYTTNHFMTHSVGNQLILFPLFTWAPRQGTWRFLENKINCFPQDQSGHGLHSLKQIVSSVCFRQMLTFYQLEDVGGKLYMHRPRPNRFSCTSSQYKLKSKLTTRLRMDLLIALSTFSAFWVFLLWKHTNVSRVSSDCQDWESLGTSPPSMTFKIHVQNTVDKGF